MHLPRPSIPCANRSKTEAAFSAPAPNTNSVEQNYPQGVPRTHGGIKVGDILLVVVSGGLAALVVRVLIKHEVWFSRVDGVADELAVLDEDGVPAPLVASE